jgi:hypothetical protein
VCFFRLSSRWIGFSLIAIFEILEFIHQLVSRPCAKQQQQQATRVHPTVQVAVIELTSKSSAIKEDLEDTQSIDEIVLVK